MSYTPIVAGTGVIGWEFLTRTREQQQSAFDRSPLLARDKAGFADRIQTIQSAEQLMDDRDMLRVALGAFGLDEDLNNRAFIRKVLESDLSDSSSLANRLADKRYLGLAQTFNFAGPDGPQRLDSDAASPISDRLGDLRRPEDLLADPALLRATLRSFGLESDAGNVFFLQKVLESDPADEASFANQLSDTRYGDLARAFDFHGRDQSGTLHGFADAFAGRFPTLQSAADLLDAPDLLDTALTLFGVDKDFANIDRPNFLKDVLQSDPYDADSFAARQEDPRYLALSKAFGFGTSGTDVSRAEKLAGMLSTRDGRIDAAQDLFNDVGLTLAVMDFFDLPQGAGKIDLAQRILASDRSDPASLINVYPDRRYLAFAGAFAFEPPAPAQSYPAGFAEDIARHYSARQFEAAIGESDPNMRIALSLERDLTQLLDRGGSADTQWFSVMASKPLRTVFETALGLPASFGTLDLDQQLGEFEKRTEQMFGTDKVSDFSEPELMDRLRRRFLLAGDQQSASGFSSGAGTVLAILSGLSV